MLLNLFASKLIQSIVNAKSSLFYDIIADHCNNPGLKHERCKLIFYDLDMSGVN